MTSLMVARMQRTKGKSEICLRRPDPTFEENVREGKELGCLPSRRAPSQREREASYMRRFAAGAQSTA